MKKIFTLLVVGLTFASGLLSQENNKKFYVKVSQNTVDSATLKNALEMENSLFLNRYIGGTTSYRIPQTGTFKGTGGEFGFLFKHSGLLQTNLGFSFASLSSGNQKSIDYSKSSLSFGSTSILSEITGVSEYTSNRLQTARIELVENVQFLHDSQNQFLKGFGARAGFEIYANEVKSTSPYSYGNSSATLSSSSGTSTAGGNFFSITSTEKLTYNEAFVNGVLGLAYTVSINDKHKIDLGADYLKSFANRGKYTSEIMSLFIIPSASGSESGFPITTKLTGDVKTELVGNRLSFGYTYQATESVSIRFTYQTTHTTHRVVDSKVKEPGNFLTLLSNSGSANMLPFLLGSQPGFGPFPENKDVRSQVGLEVAYHF
ncbi:hypothetical protein [Leptospira ilyithenensis]|uniref:Uncharacterized protein n=1 Tax=Leptospira ilyithenensis TaxID=2484901 RepID=A0A4R9LQP3_9LEPT|nr:hypothetical protein [Leptospira ilyithenensis]TGN11894.1 hypothetical protein EHS11_05125 [Leptospira ilyithenensis]